MCPCDKQAQNHFHNGDSRLLWTLLHTALICSECDKLRLLHWELQPRPRSYQRESLLSFVNVVFVLSAFGEYGSADACSVGVSIAPESLIFISVVSCLGCSAKLRRLCPRLRILNSPGLSVSPFLIAGGTVSTSVLIGYVNDTMNGSLAQGHTNGSFPGYLSLDIIISLSPLGSAVGCFIEVYILGQGHTAKTVLPPPNLVAWTLLLPLLQVRTQFEPRFWASISRSRDYVPYTPVSVVHLSGRC